MTEPTKPQRRRQSDRIDLAADLRVSVPGWPQHADGIDISLSGVGLTVERAVTIGDRIRFDLTTVAGRHHKLEAVVRRAERVGKNWRVGLEWQGLSPAERDAVAAFVRAQIRTRRRKGVDGAGLGAPPRRPADGPVL